MTASTTTVGVEVGQSRWLGLQTWPMRRPAWRVLALAGVVMVTVWSAVGRAYRAFVEDTAVGEADRDIAEWLARHRTDRLDQWSHVGSLLSDVYVKVPLVALFALVAVLVWRRWHDGLFLAVVVIFEASVFAITSVIVRRERPDVTQLDASAPTGSFPSGHAAAAVAFYSGLVLILSWHTDRRRLLRVLWCVAAFVAVIVGVSRAYRGMHHPVDIVAGWVLGVVSIVVVRRALMVGTGDVAARPDGSERPEPVLRLDLTTGPTVDAVDHRTRPSTGGQPA